MKISITPPQKPTPEEFLRRLPGTAVEDLPEMPAKMEREALKRLAIDIPDVLHRRMKKTAVERGVSMRDDVIALLEWHYGKT